MQFNILIADDEISDLDSIISNIQHQIPNISIQKSLDAKDILNNMKNIDLLIISTHLNNEESFEFVRSLEDFVFNTIFLTNDAKSDEEADKASEIGIFDFVSKPININKFKHKILHYMSIRKRELELLREKKISHSIMNTTSNPIFVTDSKKVLFSNTALLELLGYETIEEINDTFTEIKDIFNSRPVVIQDDINLLHEDKELLNQNQHTDWFSNIKNNNQHKLFINGKNGNDYVFVINSTLLDDGFTYIIHLKDITKEVEQQLELTNLLYTDNLTYLSNRTKLIEDLQNQKVNIKSLAIMDINSFKEINDFYGHKTGDTILKGIAELIIPMIITRENLLFYKFPSDIYCLANLDDDEEDFTHLIKSIIEAIEKKVFKIDPHEIDARITVGMSFSKKNNKLITADLALQAAKQDHKDYLVFYDELDNINEYKNNMVWTKKLKYALANDDIIVYYQPLINNQTLKVDKYECLVRMIDKDKVVSPFFFLEVSKRTNQYAKITKVVIEKSFKEFSTLPFEFSVNVSYEDIEDPDFIVFVKDQLSKYNVANRVVFEILEDEGIKNYDVLIDFINEVKSLGCKVAIDDFGSGYSNFEHLLKMNVDFLKIDASLIKNIATDENSYKVTKTIIDFAKNLNLKTIAEFVESKEIFDIVKELGTDYSQGYYFSAPIEKPNIYDYK
ncbi:hypothetical protein A9Q76_05580 [Arcobacter sp. 31_11_sub10_T18]|nr:hypothetical protein A9Q76_05580 [Arcobacter sp. 31_11_sub10_T18]